jgi:hypothetical protein
MQGREGDGLARQPNGAAQKEDVTPTEGQSGNGRERRQRKAAMERRTQEDAGDDQRANP